MVLLLFLLFVLLFMTVTAQPAQAQTFKVLHNFTGGADGGNPEAGLTMDKAGNLYGTAAAAAAQVTRAPFSACHKGSGWVLNPLYSFLGASTGLLPKARVIFGPDGALYGTTNTVATTAAPARAAARFSS